MSRMLSTQFRGAALFVWWTWPCCLNRGGWSCISLWGPGEEGRIPPTMLGVWDFSFFRCSRWHPLLLLRWPCLAAWNLLFLSAAGEEALTMYMDKSRLDRKSGNATQSVEALHQLASSYFVDRDGTMRRLHEIQISTGAIKVPHPAWGRGKKIACLVWIL